MGLSFKLLSKSLGMLPKENLYFQSYINLNGTAKIIERDVFGDICKMDTDAEILICIDGVDYNYAELKEIVQKSKNTVENVLDKLKNIIMIPIWCRYICIDKSGNIYSTENLPNIVNNSFVKNSENCRWFEKIGHRNDLVGNIIVLKIREDYRETNINNFEIVYWN